MAMTKKEKAEFDAAIQRANTLAALRWTGPIERDVPIPRSPNVATGWDFSIHSRIVREKWSEANYHGYCPRNPFEASGGSLALFSTKLLALRALRHAIERDAADKLRKIDEAIAEEDVKC